MGGDAGKDLSKESIKDLMIRYFEVYNTGDWIKVGSEFYSQDVVFENPELKFTGRETVVGFLDKSHRKVKETLTPLGIITDNDHVAAQVMVELKILEDVPDFHIKPVTRAEIYRYEVGVFYEMKRGKIGHLKLYLFLK